MEKEAMEAGLAGKDARALELRRALERYYEEAVTDPVVQMQNLNWLALMASYNGEQAEAIWAAEKCISTYEQEPVQRDVILAKLMLVLSYVLAEAGRCSDAIPYAEEARTKLAQVHGEDDFGVLSIAENIENRCGTGKLGLTFHGPALFSLRRNVPPTSTVYLLAGHSVRDCASLPE
jgi:hypothetical protein